MSRVKRYSKADEWNSTSVEYQDNCIRGETRKLVSLPGLTTLEVKTLREQKLLVGINNFHQNAP